MRINPKLGFLLLAILLIMPLLHALDSLPIRIWDESRLAVNALEMKSSHNWLGTTYDDQPDMWNTKPPLMIWLQVASLKLFGVSELSLRLPSAIAAFFTCFFIYWFFVKRYKNPVLGILTCLVLVTSQGYVRIHGTRTGDYDSLLVLFTTMYVVLYFMYSETNKTKYLYVFFISLILAALTKGIAGMLFLPALFLYTIIDGKLIIALKNKHLYLGIGMFVFFVIGYYLLRNHYDPWYINQIRINELGGRYLHTDQEQYAMEVMYYFKFFKDINFVNWFTWMVFGTIITYSMKDAALKRLLTFSLLTSVGYFIIVSVAQTKNEWYDMPCYPLFSIIAALGIYWVYSMLEKIEIKNTVLRHLVLILLSVVIFYNPYATIVHENHNPVVREWSKESDHITYFMKGILHGTRPCEGLSISYDDYHADVLWYQKAIKETRCDIHLVNAENLVAGQKVIAFQEHIKNYITQHYNTTVIDQSNAVQVYQIDSVKN